MNIIAGTGYYVESFIPEEVKKMTVKAVSVGFHFAHVVLSLPVITELEIVQGCQLLQMFISIFGLLFADG